MESVLLQFFFSTKSLEEHLKFLIDRQSNLHTCLSRFTFNDMKKVPKLEYDIASGIWGLRESI